MSYAASEQTEANDDDTCAFVLKDTSTATLDEAWHCPHPAVDGHRRCVFHHTAHEREAVGISESEVRARFHDALESGDPERREFVGATLTGLNFDHVDIDHDDQHPLDLRHACILGDFEANSARFEEAIDLRDANLQSFCAQEGYFGDGLFCQRATFEGEVDCSGANFTGDDVVFTDATFEDAVRFDRAHVAEAAIFDDATVSGTASFLGTTLHGRGIEIDDYTSFEATRFEGVARFDHAKAEACSFAGALFADAASFDEMRTTAPVLFDGATFETPASFDGTRFGDDASFAGVTFEDEATFEGATFEGGGTLTHADADFGGVRFAERVTFESGEMGAMTFEDVAFEADAYFSHVQFCEEASFDAATFAGEALFDGVRFDDEVTFEDATFEGVASFPGVEFEGSNNHDSASVTFDGVTFEGDANFHHAWCTSASFWGVQFHGEACFTESKFTKHLDLLVDQNGGDTVMNFTDALLADGTVVQTEGKWVRTDLTRATVGDVIFTVDGTAHRNLFQYIRFCDTRFDGFDFSEHTHFLSRSNWSLHEFDDDDLDYEYAVDMDSLAIEKTYQRAKTSASSSGNVEASGKFRFKRQQYARENYKKVASDPAEPVLTRIRNAQRVAENLFLGLTCGHGMRLYRIALVFLLFPVGPALLYTFGGRHFETEAGQITSLAELATMGGVETLAANVHFSYVTFLTIGYGNVVAKGKLGLVLVSLEAYASVVLGGLFIYVLIKRSEL